MSRRAAPNNRHAAFTLVEALVAITLTAIAASVLLMGTTSSLQATTASLEATIALGMAEQLMDEVVGCRYAEYGQSAYQTTLATESGEPLGASRELFDDIDDFNRYRSRPPVDPWGIPLGQDDGEGGRREAAFQASDTLFDSWRQEIDVYYVDPSNPTRALASGQTSDYRAVEVRIVAEDPNGARRTLAQLRRIVIYVPPLYP